VLVNAQPGGVGHRTFSGTLARMTMDGAPRPWLTGVTEADWSPDGSTLAVTRLDPAVSTLEYPIGHVLYRNTGGCVSDIRVSPDGQAVAFFDHQIFGDDRGWLRVVDRQGTVRTLAGEFWGEEGLAWASDGRHLVFSASGQGGEQLQPLIVNTTGTPQVRQALPSAGALLVLDVAKDGHVLASRDSLRFSIRALIPGETEEREFPWLDYATSPFLSPDGTALVFDDESQSAGADYAVSLRNIKSDKVVNLGPGSNGDFSPDGKWVVALLPSTGDMLRRRRRRPSRRRA
jgi:eukaryotic-like serine/threonine-protein kinase